MWDLQTIKKINASDEKKEEKQEKTTTEQQVLKIRQMASWTFTR